MELYLQFGYGMKAHSEFLIEKWNGGTVILSPRDQTLEQMKNLSKSIQKKNGKVLLDPQFYLPRCDHKNLQLHDYWPNSYNTNAFFKQGEIDKLLERLYVDYIEELEAESFILPGMYIDDLDDLWFDYIERIINSEVLSNIKEERIITIPLSERTLLKTSEIHKILEKAESWEVNGFYIVPEHPRDIYLVDDPRWLVNLIDICAGLKKLGKKVIVGYCNHQELILALSKVDAISSGIWINVRLFNKNKFNSDTEMAKRTTWYYCPQALSEYQINYLDLAKNVNILDKMRANDLLRNEFEEILFRGADPTSVNFNEQKSFRHYLLSLHKQVELINQESFENTYIYLKKILEIAEKTTEYLRDYGIRGKYRDFSDVVDATIASIDGFKKIRGLNFSHIWEEI